MMTTLLVKGCFSMEISTGIGEEEKGGAAHHGSQDPEGILGGSKTDNTGVSFKVNENEWY